MSGHTFVCVISGAVVAKMRLMVFLFVSVHLCEAVIIRIKPVRIVSYHKNHSTASSSQSSTTTVVPTITSPATMNEYVEVGEPISPSSVPTFSTKATSFTSITPPDDPVRESPETSATKFEVTSAHQVTSAATKFEVTSANPVTNSASAKLTTIVAPIVSAKNLTDRAGLFQISPYTRLFYWFFRSRSSPADPLVVWLQGQPNASSLYGAFDETGPYLINPHTKNLTGRQHSWSSSFNVLYLDPHPGCGFSYSENPLEYSVSYERVAKGILKALKQFFTLYPQLANNSLYLAAQSVGAKYAIVVAHAILQTVHRYRLNLKGVLLGGAVVDEYQLANYDYRLLTFGLVDLKTMDDMTQPQDYMAALIRTEAYSRAVEHWHQQVFSFFTKAGYQSPYDVRVVNAFWDSLVPNYMNQTNVKKEFKIGALKFQPAAKSYITSETLRPLQILIRELLSNIKVLLYHGQFDMFAPITHSIDFLNKFNWPENLDFYTSKRKNWHIGKRLAGYWSNHQNLTVLLIRNAGHMVGVTQPESMLHMLKDFTSNKFEISFGYSFGGVNWTPSGDSPTDANLV